MDIEKSNSHPPERRARTGLYARGSSALRLRARKVAKLVERLRNAAPWIEASDLPCARSWAELEILGAAVFRELAEKGVLNADGEGRRLLNDYQKLKKTQLAYETALGLTPAARIAIKAGSTMAAFDLASLMEQPLESAEAAAADTETESGDNSESS